MVVGGVLWVQRDRTVTTASVRCFFRPSPSQKIRLSNNAIIAGLTPPPSQNRPTSSSLVALSPPSTGRFKRRCAHGRKAYPLGFAAMCATLAKTLAPWRRWDKQPSTDHGNNPGSLVPALPSSLSPADTCHHRRNVSGRQGTFPANVWRKR